MSKSLTYFTELVKAEMNKADLPWKEIVSQAEELVLFGSTAAGLNGKDSDIDIFIAGGKPRRKRTRVGKVDLIWISRGELLERSWLKSELAAHIKDYGVWLKGNGEWKKGVNLDKSLSTKKRRRVTCRGEALLVNARHLPASRMKYHLTKIRRDCQRANLLEKGTSCPPSEILDRDWIQVDDREAWLFAQLSLCSRSTSLTNSLISMFSNHGDP